MDTNLFEMIKECIEKVLERSLSQLTYETSLREDLEMDSLQIVLLQVELEDEFSISFDPIDDDFFLIFNSVGSIYETIKRKCV